MPVIPDPSPSPSANALDIITLTEAKLAIGWDSGDSSRDDSMQWLVTAASNAIDGLVGPVVVRTVTETHDGTDPLTFFRQRPVYDITTVTEYSRTTGQVLAAETSSTETAYDYLYDSTLTAIRRRANGADLKYVPGRSNVVVVYRAGRFLTTNAVSALYKSAAQMLFAHLYRSEHGMGNRTFGPVEAADFGGTGAGYLIPNRVRELLARDLLTPGFA